MNDLDVKSLASETIRLGSKSFRWAGLILPKEAREGAFKLYSWCRLTDDLTDQSVLGHYQQNEGRSIDLNRNQQQLQIFETVFEEYKIPAYYVEEIKAGMKMDLDNYIYHSTQDLLLYSYRVAGVVGLMMCHVIGVSDAKALRHACDLGIAMQLTNIARDISEDRLRNRNYIPRQWFFDHGLDPEIRFIPENYNKFYPLAHRLIELADQYYRSGDQGLRFLSFRTAVAIAVARGVYSDIGNRIQQQGPNYFSHRVHVSAARKWIITLQGILKVTISRVFYGPYFWQSRSLNSVWRFQ